MRQRSWRRWSWVVLVALMASLLPPAQLRAAPEPPPIVEPPPAPPVPAVPPLTLAPPPSYPEVPTLAAAVVVAPDPLPVGATAVFTVTIWNESPYLATDLRVDLSASAGVVAVPLAADAASAPAEDLALDDSALADARAATASWRWDVPRLEAEGSAVLTGTLRVAREPAGGALLLRGSALAQGMAAPAPIQGGALVVARDRPAAEAAFAPGAAAWLRSADGTVAVDLPPAAAARALTVRHALERRDGVGTPPPHVAGRPHLGTFYLEAVDSAGQPVREFAEPLTVTVRYTPEQLAARGIAAADLTIFFFDDAAGHWVPLSTTVDADAQEARAPVDHFTPFALGDGSSVSTTYVPSLQGFQTSSFTGSMSYAVPLEVPAGPGGLTPSVGLSYSSAGSDGPGGLRDHWQAGLVGKGWSLNAGGSVMRSSSLAGDFWDHFSLVFDGRSFDIVRGQLINGCTDYSNTAALHCWSWHATDENFVRVRAELVGSDYVWKAWTAEGTRYDFTQRLWNRPDVDVTTPQVYGWLLTQTVDVHGNRVEYVYQVDTVSGTVFTPTWYLQEIRWGFDGATPGTGTPRYKVTFAVANRAEGVSAGVDANYEHPFPGNAYWRQITAHQKYRLDSISVWNQPNLQQDPALVRRLVLSYAPLASSVRSDSLNGQRVLTLIGTQLVGSDGVSALPATSYTYHPRDLGNNVPNAGANRLATISNGQGGAISITYGKPFSSGDGLESNYHRVAQVLRSESALPGGPTQTLTTYSYSAPARNTYAYSAAVAFAAYPPSGNGDSRVSLARPEGREFRGHAQVVTQHYAGATATTPLLRRVVERFYQGNGGPNLDSFQTCAPALTTLGNGRQAVVESDACFVRMVDYEAWKGRPYRVEVTSTDGLGTVLQRTTHSYLRHALPFYGADASVPNAATLSNNYRRAGLWRAFVGERTRCTATLANGETVEQCTETFYDLSPGENTNSDQQIYGNVTRQDLLVGGVRVRTTRSYYAIGVSASSYLTSRTWATLVSDGSWQRLAFRVRFYDGATTQAGIGTRGLLTREIALDMPPGHTTGPIGVTLFGRDRAERAASRRP